ncbi:hypothetical protein AMTR_s04785p00007030 [Amborella trichopoda]|uniref:Uncharacterized protein n=1 Tax=Amborella trichopoda TaxID=13333 RepID=U5CY31_AMBTC|nr:hypothetical protein AMTR_s04785p00007030 [Amborella trichopoda]
MVCSSLPSQRRGTEVWFQSKKVGLANRRMAAITSIGLTARVDVNGSLCFRGALVFPVRARKRSRIRGHSLAID